METRRLVIFLTLTFAFLMFWNYWFAPPPRAADVPAQPVSATTQTTAINTEADKLSFGQRVHVDTDLYQVQIDTVGGDLRSMVLLKYKSAEDKNKPFVLLQDDKKVYVAQSGFDNEGLLPTLQTLWHADATSYTLLPHQKDLVVRLSAPEENGIKVVKRYTFHRNTYVIDVGYEIENGSDKTITPVPYFRMLRDAEKPEGTSRFARAFYGAAMYTQQKKYQTFSFESIAKGKADHIVQCNNGWIGMTQHYFATIWLPKTSHGSDNCAVNPDRTFELKSTAKGQYFVAGVISSMPALAPGATGQISVPLYAGPQEYKSMDAVNPNLVKTKNFGLFTIIADPLFRVLVMLHSLVGNWGWSIILLTILLKALFWWPTAASYRSMAKMREVAPRIQRLKEQHGDDRQQMSKATMELYKTEKINPLGGCLPMIIQIPVFMGLYSCLLQSVELRQAPWEMWIHDLSQKDPYYILPCLMALSMWYQTTLTPAPADPMQAKMMKIMPLIFSVFFFFSPSGLVLYWFTNNLLSVTQQKLIYRKLARSKAEK